MITTSIEAKELAKKWNELNTDLERLAFLRAKDSIEVVLDNDRTHVEIYSALIDEELESFMEELNSTLKPFDKHHGYSEGVLELFKFAGINATTV